MVAYNFGAILKKKKNVPKLYFVESMLPFKVNLHLKFFLNVNIKRAFN